ncbi:RNA polymerase factor sigma-32 [Nitrospina watsonii]|uniref:RNA polymerase sigma factor n=1 Tax=Nitrospina watsonii TaxID=1323948 RepID=A0ABM9HH19_9BACT|nr:RNA polymerase factor sigma-32 [Nitrospina watsonii]CAI2719648.1 RNA polymerase sigma-B factor [Nitrospina watsonii]
MNDDWKQTEDDGEERDEDLHDLGDADSPPLEPDVVDDEDAGEDERHLPMVSGSSALAPLDPLAAYLQEIRQYSELSPEEEHELALKYQETGDVKAAYKLITHNLMLVVKIALTFRREWQHTMDLVQEGNVGLMKAVQNFDPFRGVRLPAYASWWIKAYILKFILDNWRLVKVGTTNSRRKLLYNLRKTKEKLIAEGVDPSPKLLAEHFGVDEQDVIDVEASLGAADVSMETPSQPDSTLTPMKTLADSNSTPAEELEVEQFHRLIREKVEQMLDELKPIEQELIATRILAEDPVSLKEIGEHFGITREAVRQAEQRLLKKLKLYLAEQLPEVENYFNN